MTGTIRSVCIGVATAALAFGLGACSETTYGTGTPPGMQTLQDLAGIADMGGSQKDPIKYGARPGLVPPPAGTPLPPPRADQQAVAANWPKDPEADAKRVKAEAIAREKACAASQNRNVPECFDPGFTLPETGQANDSREPSPTIIAQRYDPGDLAHSTKEQDERAKKLFADARGQVAVDENGKPIRRYLTDPPSDYRLPDPDSPVEIENKPATKKKWKWPWE